jgi:hypothetical protein
MRRAARGRHGVPLSQRGAGGISPRVAHVRASENPPRPPFGKGGSNSTPRPPFGKGGSNNTERANLFHVFDVTND